MLDLVTLLDSQTAEIIMSFDDGTVHTETFDLYSGDSMDALCEIDRCLHIFLSEPKPRAHDEESWYVRSTGETEASEEWDEDFAEYFVEAATTLAAIFDTYTSNKPRELLNFQTLMVDHLGNKLPLDIEYNI